MPKAEPGKSGKSCRTLLWRLSNAMSTPIRYDSADVPENDAEEIWREGLDAIFESERPRDPPGPFRAKMEIWALGSMLLMSHVGRGVVEFQRPRRRIATSGVDHYLVHCLL